MSSTSQPAPAARRSEPSSRWAPWWVYVLVIVPANIGKEGLLSAGTPWFVRGALTAAVVLGGIALVTAFFRMARGREQRPAHPSTEARNAPPDWTSEC